MNLNHLIPDNRDCWIIKNNIIYVEYCGAKIPILMKEDLQNWIFFDNKIRKYILRMVQHLQKSNIDFLFRCPSVFFSHKLSKDDFNIKNLESYMSHIIEDKFYNGFDKIEFDFSKNITEYLVKFEGFDVFKPIIDRYKRKASSKEYDYWTNKDTYIIQNEYIRDYVMTLEREIKLSLLI